MMETVQKQKQNKSIKQNNSGSDASTNINCGDNDIDSPAEDDVQVCGTLALDLGVLGMDGLRD